MRQLYDLFALIFISLSFPVQAQQKKIDFNFRAGFSVGGTSPIGFPESIRKIKKYNPGLLLSLEAGSIYHFSQQWAIASGVRFEQKGMTTEAKVKGYYTTFNTGNHSGDESITGYYTGNVKTSVKNSYVTIPLHVIRKVNSTLSIKVGGFASLLLEKSFTGAARDGYLRGQSPVGEKEEITEAAYDFSDQIRQVNAGIELGANYRINSRLAASINLNFGLTPLMKSRFESIDFKLFNLFANPGLVYHF